MLLETGSQINAISTEWYNKHKKQMGKLDVLKVTHMIMKGAVGRKSKPITQQVMLEIRIGEYITDSVFIIVPNLIRDCIIGISLLQESKCIINLKDNHITFNNNTNRKIPVCSEILTVEIAEEEEKIETTIQEKLEETTGIRARKQNEGGDKLKFKEGDLVLIRTNPISDALNKITAKFCELYDGPYVVTNSKGEATYVTDVAVAARP